MAEPTEVTRINLIADHRHTLFRIQQQDRKQLEKLVFQRYPYREWGTFFHFGFRRTPWGIAISYVDGFWSEPGDLDRQSSITEFQGKLKFPNFRGRWFRVSQDWWNFPWFWWGGLLSSEPLVGHSPRVLTDNGSREREPAIAFVGGLGRAS